MNTQELDKLISRDLNADCIEHLDEIQTLWDGYGTIERIMIHGAESKTAIVKHIDLGQPAVNRRSVSHRRKHKSYLVEIEWYRRFSAQCDASCRVPLFYGAAATDESIYIVLEDLDAAGFSLRRDHTNAKELDACLYWLANFHATFLNCRPEGLWKIGTYWHLGTRTDEYNKMPKGKLKAKAGKLDKALNSARYQTFVHGDAKPANFCFSREAFIAAVDFQYVGRGCGIKDIAYLLWGATTSEETEMLDLYFEHLQPAIKSQHPRVDFEALKNEWTTLYPTAKEDFKRFLRGWLPNQ